jgi:hypothetical protein
MQLSKENQYLKNIIGQVKTLMHDKTLDENEKI